MARGVRARGVPVPRTRAPPLQMPLPTASAPLLTRHVPAEPVAEAPQRWPELANLVVIEVGVLFVIVGGADLALSWYPFAFQNPEWEFGTVTAMLDGLPALVLGLGLVLTGALYSGIRWLARAASVAFAVLAACVVAAGLLYATTVPLALRVADDPTIRLGLFKAMIKTSIQAIAYPSICFWIAVKSWR